MSRMRRPCTRVASASTDPGTDCDGVAAEVSAGAARQEEPAVAGGLALMRRFPLRGQRGELGHRRARAASNSSSGLYDRIHASSGRRWPGFVASGSSGTWWARNVPSILLAVDLRGTRPALGRAQDDHRPARRSVTSPAPGRPPGSRGSRSRASSSAPAILCVHRLGHRRPRRSAASSRSPEAARPAPHAGSAPGWSGWRSCSR